MDDAADAGLGQAERVDKILLTPFGETMPYISRWKWLETQLLDLGARVDEAALATDAEAPAIGSKELYALIEQAGETYADDVTLRTAALEIERPDARAAIYAVLFDVAASDMVSEREGELLDWLSDEWELDTHTALPGEATDVGADVS